MNIGFQNAGLDTAGRSAAGNTCELALSSMLFKCLWLRAPDAQELISFVLMWSI